MKNKTASENQALIIALVSQIAIAFVKLGYGYYAALVSMKADGYHSFLDGASSLVGLIGVSIARKPPDSDHPYGHGKFEYLTTMGISMLLFFTAYKVSSEAYHRFFSHEVPLANVTSFVIILATIAINYLVCRYQENVGRKLGSQILLADAAHTRSDIWASLSVLIALVAIRSGFPILDPVCAIFIVVLIISVGYHIVRESFSVLTDSAIIDSGKVRRVVLATEGVKGCHRVRTRGTVNDIHIDLHLEVDGAMEMREGYDVVKEVERRIREEFHGLSDVMIHLEPHR
ncbi:MAG: cation diffusion facilitator family transporter [Candidatus Glassbacteria bacterium]